MAESITIVDDSDELRYLIALLLKEELGLPCLPLSSFRDVVSHADLVEKSDLVILDVNLGVGQPDGVAVYRWLRDRQFPGRIIFLTGHAMDSPQVQEAARTGVRVLEKPMTPEALINALKDSMSAGRPAP